MTKFSKQFTYTDCDDNGLQGLRMAGRPDFDAGTGMTVAHDLLEHITPRGGAAGEAEAFGAMLYIRIEGGLEAINYRSMTPRDTANELLGLVEMHEDGECAPPEAGLLYDPEVEDDWEEFFHTLKTSKEYDGPDETSISEETRDNLAKWAVHGYLTAREKYPNEYRAAELFYEAEELVDRFLKGDRYEGDQVELIVNPEEYSVELKVITGYCDLTGYYMVGGERDPDMNDEEEEDSEDYT